MKFFLNFVVNIIKGENMKENNSKLVLKKMKEIGLQYTNKTGGFFDPSVYDEYTIIVKNNSINLLSYENLNIEFKADNAFMTAIKDTEKTFKLDLFK